MAFAAQTRPYSGVFGADSFQAIFLGLGGGTLMITTQNPNRSIVCRILNP